MKTKTIALMLIIVSLFIFVGCDADGAYTADSAEESIKTILSERMEFLFVNRCPTADFYYYRDVYTDVVYVLAYRSSGYGGGGSFIPLLSTDGTPILWSEIENAKEITK